VTDRVRPTPFLERADRFGRVAETVLLTFVLGAMIVLAAGQIVLRNVWGTGFGWGDEALRIMVLWIAMIGAVAASREKRHVSVDALSRYLPRSLSRWTGKLVDAFVSVVCGVLAWQSYLFAVESLAADDRVLGGDIPAWTVQLILPVGFALIGYRYAVACFSRRPASVETGQVH